MIEINPNQLTPNTTAVEESSAITPSSAEENLPFLDEDDEITPPEISVDPPADMDEVQNESDLPDEGIQVTQQNVTQAYSINQANKLNSGDELILPSHFDSYTQKTLENTPNVKLADSQSARDWANTVAGGMELSAYGDTYIPTLEDSEADFQHRFEEGGVPLTAQAPRLRSAENQNLKGEKAVLRVTSHLGLGTIFQVPLWHSGLWVTFKPPTDSELIELNRLMISDKIKFGRYAYGMAFSNTTAYTVDRLVDFALAHVYETTAKTEDLPIEKLKSFISSQDIPSLLWGFTCTIYPRGFNYRRACVADPSKCNFVLEETLNLMKLQWTNINALTAWQKVFMSERRSRSKDLASIKRYKEELLKIKNHKLVIHEGQSNEFSMVIKTPTISEYIDSGHRWIGSIVDAVDKTLNLDISDVDRNAYIINHGQATAMRQYTHWVQSIEVDTNIIDDKETVEQTLDSLSRDDEIMLAFTKGVTDYINHSTVSVIGIPVFDCPKCNQLQKSDMDFPHHTNIIPLDVMQLFFGLLTQRLSKLTNR